MATNDAFNDHSAATQVNSLHQDGWDFHDAVRTVANDMNTTAGTVARAFIKEFGELADGYGPGDFR